MTISSLKAIIKEGEALKKKRPGDFVLDILLEQDKYLLSNLVDKCFYCGIETEKGQDCLRCELMQRFEK